MQRLDSFIQEVRNRVNNLALLLTIFTLLSMSKSKFMIFMSLLSLFMQKIHCWQNTFHVSEC